MFGGFVGDSVLPAAPDDVEPGAGEDADRVGVVVSSGDGAVVHVGGPGVGVSAVAGEVGDGVAELFVCGPTESDVFDFAGLAGVAVEDLAAALRRRTAERDELKALLARAEKPRAMSAAQISELVEELGGLSAVLGEATGAERAQV